MAKFIAIKDTLFNNHYVKEGSVVESNNLDKLYPDCWRKATASEGCSVNTKLDKKQIDNLSAEITKEVLSKVTSEIKELIVADVVEEVLEKIKNEASAS